MQVSLWHSGWFKRYHVLEFFGIHIKGLPNDMGPAGIEPTTDRL